uniref:Transmembrane protein n=1 Tax=Panagrolaimus sp. ES5 TaxID=591445 RepID=A0AC34F9G3_9BILA
MHIVEEERIMDSPTIVVVVVILLVVSNVKLKNGWKALRKKIVNVAIIVIVNNNSEDAIYVGEGACYGSSLLISIVLSSFLIPLYCSSLLNPLFNFPSFCGKRQLNAKGLFCFLVFAF